MENEGMILQVGKFTWAVELNGNRAFISVKGEFDKQFRDATNPPFEVIELAHKMIAEVKP